MKKQLLEKLGWKLHTIPWFEWRDLKGKDGKVDYLKKMLANDSL
jgi:hypothetical protein